MLIAEGLHEGTIQQASHAFVVRNGMVFDPMTQQWGTLTLDEYRNLFTIEGGSWIR